MADPTPQEVANEVVHGVVFAAILAAGIFVKNPGSQAMASKLSTLAVELLQGLEQQTKA